MRAVIVASTLLLFVTALEWSLIDALTPFLYPILLLVVAVIFLVGALWAVAHAVAHRSRGWVAGTPLLLAASAGAVVILTPFTDLWLRANYRWYQSNRQSIVREVEAGAFQPGPTGLVALGPTAPRVSMGGNEIVVQEHNEKRYVFFYTYRGILDNYSGFLFVPAGGDPRRFGDFGEVGSTQIQELEPGWYFATHW